MTEDPTADPPAPSPFRPGADDPAQADPEALARALGALLDSLLVHLHDRRLLEAEDIDEIYETAIGAHRSREGDALSARIVAVLARMQSDGATTGRPR